MTKIQIAGVNALDEAVQLSKDVVKFTDDKSRVSVTIVDQATVRLVTTKGSYTLAKHPTLNMYQGTFNGHKCQITLKKIIGTITYR